MRTWDKDKNKHTQLLKGEVKRIDASLGLTDRVFDRVFDQVSLTQLYAFIKALTTKTSVITTNQ